MAGQCHRLAVNMTQHGKLKELDSNICTNDEQVPNRKLYIYYKLRQPKWSLVMLSKTCCHTCAERYLPEFFEYDLVETHPSQGQDRAGTGFGLPNCNTLPLPAASRAWPRLGSALARWRQSGVYSQGRRCWSRKRKWN